MFRVHIINWASLDFSGVIYKCVLATSQKTWSPLLKGWVWASSWSWWWQGSLACCTPWDCKESDTTEQLNWTERWQITYYNAKSAKGKGTRDQVQMKNHIGNVVKYFHSWLFCGIWYHSLKFVPLYFFCRILFYLLLTHWYSQWLNV